MGSVKQKRVSLSPIVSLLENSSSINSAIFFSNFAITALPKSPSSGTQSKLVKFLEK